MGGWCGARTSGRRWWRAAPRASGGDHDAAGQQARVKAACELNCVLGAIARTMARPRCVLVRSRFFLWLPRRDRERAAPRFDLNKSRRADSSAIQRDARALSGLEARTGVVFLARFIPSSRPARRSLATHRMHTNAHILRYSIPSPWRRRTSRPRRISVSIQELSAPPRPCSPPPPPRHRRSATGRRGRWRLERSTAST